MKQKTRTRFTRWMKGFLLQHMMGMITCRQFEEFVQAYLDNELPRRQKRVFEWHLKLCPECREYMAAYSRTIELGQAVFTEPEAAIPGEVPEDLVKAVLEARRH